MGVIDANLLSPVKPFSIRRRIIYPILSVYSGLFFAGLIQFEKYTSAENLLPWIPWKILGLVVAWILFLTGLLIGLFFMFGSGGIGLERRASPPVENGQTRDEFAPLMAGLLILLLAFHVKTSLLERIQVQGESMNPTLNNGQILWIEKLSTGLQLPDLDFPVRGIFKTGKIPWYGLKLPERGDIVVFRYPGTVPGIFIKRVIGLPGERFAFRGGKVLINGHPLSEQYLAAGTRTHLRPEIQQPPVSRPPPQLDLLGPEVKYSALYGCGETGIIPDHTVLVLGDNRAFSRDSRALGFIPTFFLVGTLIDMKRQIGN